MVELLMAYSFDRAGVELNMALSRTLYVLADRGELLQVLTAHIEEHEQRDGAAEQQHRGAGQIGPEPFREAGTQLGGGPSFGLVLIRGRLVLRRHLHTALFAERRCAVMRGRDPEQRRGRASSRTTTRITLGGIPIDPRILVVARPPRAMNTCSLPPFLAAPGSFRPISGHRNR